MAENWSYGLFFALVGLIIGIIASWRWSRLYANTFIDDVVVANRQRYRTYGIWGFILLAAGVGCMIENYFLFIGVGMLFGYSRAIFEPYYNTSVINDLNELCLYLRPFDVDNQNRWANRKGFIKGYMGIPESIEKYLCQEMNERIAQTFAIGNPNNNLPSTFSSTNIYSNDEEWKDTVATLAKNAQVIVVRIGESEGCMWEIAHCTENSLLNKTILLIDDIEKLDLIKEEVERYCPIDISGLKDIKTSFALFIDEQGEKWVAFPLYSKADIKKLIESYLDSHKTLFTLLKRHEKENSVFKNEIPSGSTPAKWWQIVSLLANPIAHCLFNKWPKRWCITFLVYFVFAILLSSAIIVSIAVNNHDEMGMGEFIVFFTLLMYILLSPWLWLGPRISWRCRNWGSELLFAKSNKSLALWLLACNICIFAISILQTIVV